MNTWKKSDEETWWDTRAMFKIDCLLVFNLLKRRWRTIESSWSSSSFLFTLGNQLLLMFDVFLPNLFWLNAFFSYLFFVDLILKIVWAKKRKYKQFPNTEIWFVRLKFVLRPGLALIWLNFYSNFGCRFVFGFPFPLCPNNSDKLALKSMVVK